MDPLIPSKMLQFGMWSLLAATYYLFKNGGRQEGKMEEFIPKEQKFTASDLIETDIHKMPDGEFKATNPKDPL